MNNLKTQKKYRKKKKLGSYPYFSVVFSITLALFVIGLFGLLILHTKKLTEVIKENVEVQIYLNKAITETDKIKINKTLANQEFVLIKDGEAQITFISKEDAAEQFIKDTGEDFAEFLGDNPLHDAYSIKLMPEYQNEDNLKTVKEEIEAMPGIHEVTFDKTLINSINKNVTHVSLILGSFAIILLITVTILINNTIKLALFSQRFLIRSMQLVGATSSFIQRPFLYRASLHGFLAGVLATVLLVGILFYANNQVPDLTSLQNTNDLLFLFLFIITLGFIIGLFSTFRAVSKYLKYSLDDLY